jgi:uncharacterized protein with PIN domain
MLPQHDPAHKTTAPRLLVDAMLGRLARWLRLLGYDAAYWRAGSDDELIEAARAEGRLIVTKDHRLAGRRGIKAILIESQRLDEQIAEVRALLADDPLPAPFSRCPECNGLLAELPREEARDLVPAYVWHTQHQFRRCPKCGRVYWRGTHYPDLQARIA